VTTYFSNVTGCSRHNTEIRYFNGRRYDVLTAFSTLTNYPQHRGFDRAVYVNGTHKVSFRYRSFTVRGLVPDTEMEAPF
jgi:hypothetical protein